MTKNDKKTAIESELQETNEIVKQNENVTVPANKEIEKVEKIEFTGEVFYRTRIDEETKEEKKSVAIVMHNPFVDLFRGGRDVEKNHTLSLGFKKEQAKKKVKFIYKLETLLETQEKVFITGFVKRERFFDEKKYKAVHYFAILVKNPFGSDDGYEKLTITNDNDLGLFEMFADERLLPYGKK